jgi:hypothetical protein
MAKENLRKTMDEILSEDYEAEFNPNHVNDWNNASSSEPFKIIERDYPYEKRPFFNIKGAISSPKSVKFRQMIHPWDDGKSGDYLFVDASGGKMGLPYKLFKRLF